MHFPSIYEILDFPATKWLFLVLGLRDAPGRALRLP